MRRQSAKESPPPRAGEAGLPQGGRTGGGEVGSEAVLARQRARRLRNTATEAELELWRRLRRRQIVGRRFRRQQPLGRYIVDFVCLEERLVVEVDGSQHLEQQGYDEQRQLWVEGEGYRVLRFWNDEVLAQTEAVVEAIASALETGASGPAKSRIG